jgi:hypothetical protein
MEGTGEPQGCRREGTLPSLCELEAFQFKGLDEIDCRTWVPVAS